MFLVTSIAMLRERTSGTLERLMTLPLAKLDLLLGYGLAFALVAVVQASIASAVAFGLLGLDVEGSVALVVALAVANAVLGMALGLFLSAFASTEFQAVQFMPAVILPQLLLCGLLVPRDLMAPVLEWISYALPMTYAYDALAQATSGEVDLELALDVAVVTGVDRRRPRPRRRHAAPPYAVGRRRGSGEYRGVRPQSDERSNACRSTRRDAIRRSPAGSPEGYAFAVVMLAMIGVFQIIAGLVAIIDDDFYVIGENYTFNLDTSGWGWIHLLLGIVLVARRLLPLHRRGVGSRGRDRARRPQRDRELLLHPVLPVLVDPRDRAGRLGDLGADAARRGRLQELTKHPSRPRDRGAGAYPRTKGRVRQVGPPSPLRDSSSPR